MLGLAMVAVLLLTCVVAVGVAGLVTAQRRAQAAADLGALAGAVELVRGGPAPCRAAAVVVRGNGAQPGRCLTGADEVWVETSVSALPGLGTSTAWRLRARALAGPR